MTKKYPTKPTAMDRQIVDRFHVATRPIDLFTQALEDSFKAGAIDSIPARDLLYLWRRMIGRHLENRKLYNAVMGGAL